MNTQHNYAFESNGREVAVFSPTSFSFNPRDNRLHLINEHIGEAAVKLDRRSPIAATIKQFGDDVGVVSDLIMKSRVFTIDGEVVDSIIPRTMTQKMFTHEKSLLQQMADTLGINAKGKTEVVKHSINYNDIGTDGGEFNVNVGYRWSAFDVNVTTFTELMRFLCSNLMSVQDRSAEYYVPLINSWEENIAISNEALVHSFNTKIRPLMAMMPETRISYFMGEAIRNLLNRFSEAKHLKGFDSVRKVEAIKKTIQGQLDVVDKCAGRRVTAAMAKSVELPISTFDAYNMLTECNTHYFVQPNEIAGGLANSLVFEQNIGKKSLELMAAVIDDKPSNVNTDLAFFGLVH